MAICFTGDFRSASEKVYTLDYYRARAREVRDSGAHMLAIKDMAGLLKPYHAADLIKVIREELDAGVAAGEGGEDPRSILDSNTTTCETRKSIAQHGDKISVGLVQTSFHYLRCARIFSC